MGPADVATKAGAAWPPAGCRPPNMLPLGAAATAAAGAAANDGAAAATPPPKSNPSKSVAGAGGGAGAGTGAAGANAGAGAGTGAGTYAGAGAGAAAAAAAVTSAGAGASTPSVLSVRATAIRSCMRTSGDSRSSSSTSQPSASRFDSASSGAPPAATASITCSALVAMEAPPTGSPPAVAGDSGSRQSGVAATFTQQALNAGVRGDGGGQSLTRQRECESLIKESHERGGLQRPRGAEERRELVLVGNCSGHGRHSHSDRCVAHASAIER